MNSVGTIPPFVAFNRRVNDMMNGCVSTFGTLDSKIQEAIERSNGINQSGNSIREGTYAVPPNYGTDWMAYRSIIIGGYSAEEMANLFFGIKSITYSWTGNFVYSDRELTLGNDEDGNPIPRYPNMTILSGGWSGSRTFFASDWIRNTGDPTYSYLLPQMRSCEIELIALFPDPSEDINPPNVLSSAWPTHFPFWPRKFEDGTFFWEINPSIFCQTSFYGGEYDPATYVDTNRPSGVSIIGYDDLPFPYSFHLVPFTFSDGNKTVNGNLWALSDHGSGLKLESFDMTLNIQVNRFSFS